ncbi:hypothetical protein CVT26_006887 [Gymnopilus dilepis]|uniref:Uncharacterized protein n=1 Tax=Gymnopilus dilepis TaxID=231916 RepID=A0A409W106_9AGAR|nr:hypothetical protein CVT26_006887 [Gymnopilus dilepis]
MKTSEDSEKTLVWLITGARCGPPSTPDNLPLTTSELISHCSLLHPMLASSSGIGYELAQQALLRSEKVIATSRAGGSFANLEALKAQGAKILELDVTSPLEILKEVAKEAVGIYGRIDVLVNNAGYICNGTIEETTPQETYDQFNTNLFGAINVARVFLPYMREKRTGTLVWISSLYGLVVDPYFGNYIGTKWAMRGISQSIHGEISPLGLRSICVEFGHTRTAVLEPERRKHKGTAIPNYEDVVNRMEASTQAMNGKQPGDPVKVAQTIIDTIRGEGVAKGKAFPLDLLLGSESCLAVDATKKNLELFEEWKDVTYGVDMSDHEL